MRSRTSTFLIAVGAIMRYAVSARSDGFDLPMIGGILMLVGLAGAFLTLFLFAASRNQRAASRTVVVAERPAPRTIVVDKREVA